MDRRLMALFEAALDAARAELCLPPHLPEAPKGRTVVVGAGKAAAAMAKAVEDHWPGPLEGLVVTRYGHGIATRRIEVVEAGHPVPDAEGTAAARRIVELLEGLGKDDLALLLISGGGSALLSLPAPGLTLEDKRVLTAELLRAGATIHEINTVRKHLSAVKGGRLALRAHPARLVSLMISDVAGDDPAVIASGPGVADPTTFADARAVLAKYRIDAPPAIAAHLASAREETPKPGDPRLASAETRLIATPSMAFAAAAERAEKEGLSTVLLGDELEGEACALARAHAARALEYRRDPTAQTKPRVLLSGGEATVTLTGQGRGGPNAEYLLALALALDGAAGIHAIACDTDGIDGSEDNAGAVIAPDTLARARARGLDAAEHLARNDSYGFFSALGDLVVTGPTLTNVNDFRAILIEPL
jgi:hydroxypyruvate reductase